MTFLATNNRIVITRANGIPVFDTDNKMPAIIHTLNGGLAIPFRPNSTPLGSANHFIGNVTGGADFIFGQAYVADGNARLWRGMRTSFSGSLICQAGAIASGGRWYLTVQRILTPVIIGGAAYINEQYSCNPFNVQLDAFTLQYKLYIGKFI